VDSAKGRGGGNSVRHERGQAPFSPSPTMSNSEFHLQGYADAKPSEAIQSHELPGLAVAVVFPGKPDTEFLATPVKQYKEFEEKAKGKAARSLAQWLREQSAEGLQLTGFFQVANQVAAATMGLSLLEELPNTRVEPHFDTYRLHFEDDHVDFAQAIALEYYEFTISLGVLRAGLSIPREYRKLFVAMDRFPGRSPENVTPGVALEPTPGARFLKFVRERSSTGQHIRRENESIGLNSTLGTIDWWRPDSKQEWRLGKSHPHFVLPDWLAAAALARIYPTEFAGAFVRHRVGEDAVDGLGELYSTFKCFDLWSTSDSASYIKGGVQAWTVPDDARAFILDRAEKRKASTASPCAD